MSNKSIYVSYSAASRFKTCPTKYYLSKQYQSKLIPSALPLGKAIESGVESLLLGSSLEEALEVFRKNWLNEHIKDNQYRGIFDNLDLQFYFSDFDRNLIVDSDAKLLAEWAEELLDETEAGWYEIFDNISSEIKSDKGVSEAEMAFYNRVIWLCCNIRGEIMLKAFYNNLLPKLTILRDKDKKPYAQREVSIQNDEGDKLIGYVDFVVIHEDYREPIIVDLKTSAYPYTEHALTTSEQLRTYVAALGDEVKTKRAGYIVLVKKIKVEKSCNSCGSKREGLAKKCKACNKGEYTVPSFDADVQFITKAYKDVELDDVLEDYLNVTVAIKNEVNFKNPSNCTQYGRKCEFYDMCWGQKKASEIPNLEEKVKTSSLTNNKESDTNK